MQQVSLCVRQCNRRSATTDNEWVVMQLCKFHFPTLSSAWHWYCYHVGMESDMFCAAL